MSPVPRWFWLLGLLAMALWWPIAPFWQSDDFIAVHYAQDPARALADFTGPQYGAADLWFFWRPLITLSFCLDAFVGGGEPFWAHFSNVFAHALSALLVGLLWRRLLDDRLAFAAGLLWAIAPGHAGTIAWAVGRVDGHTTVWCLLCLWLFVRYGEGRHRTRLLSLAALVLALASKELALAVPGLVLLIAFAYGGPGLRARTRHALRAVWPYAVVLLACLLFRFAVLGRFGGYSGTQFEPKAMAVGFGSYVRDLVDPLWWIDPALAARWTGPAAPWLPWLGLLPAAVAAAYCLRPGRFGSGIFAVSLFVLASVPVAGFFNAADNHHNLRYFYFPFAALAGLLVAAGRLPALLALCAFLPPFAAVRFQQWQADRDSAAMHRTLVRQVRDAVNPGPWFVAGLPHTTANGAAIQFHFGIDRMLEPPFGPGGVRLFAHRPILPTPGALLLLDDEGLPIAPPAGTTFLFRGAGLFLEVPPRSLPELPLVVESRGNASPPEPWHQDGAVDLTGARLQALKDWKIHLRLRAPGVREPAFRVTIFTSTGYLCAIVPDHAPAGAPDGEIDLLRFFGGDRAAGIKPPVIPPASFTTDVESFVLRGLEVPTIVDLVPEFPVLVEAGPMRGERFVPKYRARELVTFRFDRGLPRAVRRMRAVER